MDQKDERLIEQLKQLPKVKDRQNKALLFEQIDQKIKGVKVMKKRNRFKWVVPSIATIAIAALAFIMIQSGLFNQEQATELSMDLSGRSSELTEHDTSGEVTTLDQDESIESDEVEEIEQHNKAEEFSEEVLLGNRLVYYNDEHDFPIYNMAVTDQQVQYFIPISLVDTATTPDIDYPDDVYNRISSMIDADKFGVKHFPFDDVEFIFSDDRQEITMAVADDYQFPEGGALAGLFPTMISFMFSDYPATELNLETAARDSIDLGQIGTMETLELEPVENLAFKIYQYEDKERLLIPISQTIAGDSFFTIDEALMEMQYDQPEFDITASIPVNLEWIDPANEETLIIGFESNPKLSNNRETKEMIEAILMTAKSFGFTQVEFDLGTDLTEVSQFNLTEPIPVPDGVNPILSH